MAKHGRKCLPRDRRLKSARKWLAGYRGKNLVRGYKRWFGVSDVCAVLELRMLGVDIPDARLDQARRDEQARAEQNARRKQKRRLPTFDEFDRTFAFIAGYTEGGAPYGVTWEEMEASAEPMQTPRIRASGPVGSLHRRVNGVSEFDDDESLPF